jgi:glycosyltransferase involved in cell wall biosynthesis
LHHESYGTAQVDIIIATRDYGRFLGDAIASALAQTGVDVVVTVVDDGSTDDTSAVVAGFDSADVRYVRFEYSRGTAAARNRGLADTCGQFVAFLDADDVWPPDRTLVLLKALESSGADYSHGVSRTFEDPNPPSCGPTTLVRGPAPGNTLLARTAMDAGGRFDEDATYLSFSSWLARAQAMGLRGIATERIVVERRLHSANISRHSGKRLAGLAMVRKHMASGGQSAGQ